MQRTSLTHRLGLAAITAILIGSGALPTAAVADESMSPRSTSASRVDRLGASIAESIANADGAAEESPESYLSAHDGLDEEAATPSRGVTTIARLESFVGLALQRTRTVIVSLSMPKVDPTLQSDFTRIQV